MLRKYPHKRRAQTAELILFDEFVQVHAQQLEDQAEMLAVDEGVAESKEMVVVVLVEFAVDLGRVSLDLVILQELQPTKSSTDTSIIL